MNNRKISILALGLAGGEILEIESNRLGLWISHGIASAKQNLGK